MDNMIKQISIIHRVSGINLDKQLKRLGVTHGQVVYVMCVCDHEGLSQEQLSAELRIDKGAVARAVGRLERDGYLSRTVSSDDKRQYRLYPTERARGIYQQVLETDAEWEKRLTKELTAAERAELKRLLAVLVKGLD